jgi:hypothetical protein
MHNAIIKFEITVQKSILLATIIARKGMDRGSANSRTNSEEHQQVC